MTCDLSEKASQNAFEMFEAALLDKTCSRNPDSPVPAFGGVPLPNFCVFLGSVHTFNSLLESGLRCETLDQKGNSPLHVASILNYCEDMFRGLLSSRDILEATSDCGQTALHAAARANNLLAAQEILGEYLAIIDLKDEQGSTALHIAAYMGSLTVAAYLIDQGADIDATDQFGRSAVHCAALSSNHKSLTQLQKLGANIMAVDRDGRTILHYAAISNRSLLRHLLDNAVFDVNVCDKFGFTPLHYATMTSSLKTIKCLCSYDANIVARGVNGLTPFHIASSLSEMCSVLEFFASKLGSEEYMSIRMDSGLSPLHLAAEFNRISRVDLLLAEGVCANISTENGVTPLHVAAFNGDQLIIKHLIEKGASVDSLTNEGHTPLHFAMFRPSLHVIQTLVQNGANIEQKNTCGITPLMLAARSDPQRSFSVVAYLLENGANLKIADTNGRTALHYAVSARNLKTVELLISNDADMTGNDTRGRNILHLAVFNKDDLMINFISEKACSLWDTFDAQGFSPIHLAAIVGAVAVVEKHLKSAKFETIQGKNPSMLSLVHLAAIYDRPKIIRAVCRNEEKKNRRTTQSEEYWCGSADSCRRIPLHYAMAYGHLECVKLLAMKGTYLNWTDGKGFSPLHLAASNGQLHCLEFVLSTFSGPILRHNLRDVKKRTFGMLAIENRSSKKLLFVDSDVTLVDDNGRGYLHRAVMYRRLDLLPHFLHHIHPNISDKSGVTPLHIAAHCGFIDVMVILVNQGASLTAQDTKGMTPADYAAKNGQLVAIDFIIVRWSAHKSISLQKQGPPPIVTAASFLLACLRGYFDCVLMLHKLCANFVDCRDNRGRTPLHNAAAENHYEIVEFLVEKGSSIDTLDMEGLSPMMLTVRNKANNKIIDLLMNAGADASLVDFLGNNVLHLACACKNEEALKVIFAHLEESDCLSSMVEAINDSDENIFHICVRNGLIDTVKFLTPYFKIDSLFVENSFGQVPLFAALSASQTNQLACMFQLLPYYLSDEPTATRNPISNGDTTVRNYSSKEDTSELEVENGELANE